MERKRFDYDKTKLKEELNSTLKKDFEPIQEKKIEREPDKISGKVIFKILFVFIVGYVFLSSLPTYLMLHFTSISFGFSQIIVLTILILVSYMLGLHKPASPEKLAKRKKKKKK